MKDIRQRYSALILVLVIVCAVLGSAVFSALFSSHECHDDDCTVCAQLTVCDDLLETTAGTALPTVVITAASAAAAVIIIKKRVCLGADTLITLKTELLN